MADLIGKVLRGRRSLEAALNDLRIKYEQHPTAELARMIQQLEAEITIQKRPPKRRK